MTLTSSRLLTTYVRHRTAKLGHRPMILFRTTSSSTVGARTPLPEASRYLRVTRRWKARSLPTPPCSPPSLPHQLRSLYINFADHSTLDCHRLSSPVTLPTSPNVPTDPTWEYIRPCHSLIVVVIILLCLCPSFTLTSGSNTWSTSLALPKQASYSYYD